MFQDAGYVSGTKAPAASDFPKIIENLALFCSVAVVKVTPLMGCVKYKAQHVVLAVRIPLLTRA